MSKFWDFIRFQITGFLKIRVFYFTKEISNSSGGAPQVYICSYGITDLGVCDI